MINFGSGRVITSINRYADGSVPAVPQMIELGIVQNVDLSIEKEVKKLYGSGTYPVAIAGGKGSVSAKAKFAEFNGRLLSDLVLNSPSTGGFNAASMDNLAAIPVGLSVTVTPPSSGTFVSDLGAKLLSTGNALTRVAGAPGDGEYSVTNAGVYTFNAAQEAEDVSISYEYAIASVGQSGKLANLQMGLLATFSMWLTRQYDGHSILYKFPKCVAPTFSLPGQNDDFTVSDLDIECFADAAGNVFYWGSSE